MSGINPATQLHRRLVGSLAAATLIAGAFALNTPTAHAAEGETVSSGTLSWGLKASFRSYLVGPIAQGTITATAPATDPGTAAGVTTFASATGQWSTSSGSLATRGAVTYTGHHGALNFTITKPKLIATGNNANLVVDATDSAGTFHDDLILATINLTGKVATTAATTTITAAPATLTKAGESLFVYEGGAMYTEGAELAPVSASFSTAKATKATAAKPTLKITKTPSSKKTGKATVKVGAAKGKATPTGKVRIKVAKGTSVKYVNATLTAGSRTVTLPKLKKGTWTVYVTYYGDKNYQARGYTKIRTLKIKK